MKRKTVMLLMVVLALAALFAGCCMSHEWEDATCAMPRTCVKCGETEGEPLTHTWTEATCLTAKYCSVCQIEDGAALGHHWQEASCTSPETCRLCGETAGEKLEHIWQDVSCAAPKHCTLCGLTDGEALPHTWVDATCTLPKSCAVCGTAEGEALGHTWTDATCQKPQTCSVCGETQGITTAHTEGKWKVKQAATCTEAGTETTKCTICGEKLERQLPITEHTVSDWVVETAATLTEKGQRVKKCTGCDQIFETEEYELTGEEYEKAYKKACEKYKYKTIARNPDKYKGQLAKFTGEVIQVMETELFGYTFYTLRVNVTRKGSYYKYYTDTVYVTYTASEDEPKILEDDIITMYGELAGAETYTTIFGASVTIPAFDAEYIDIK